MANTDIHRELHALFNGRDFEQLGSRFNADAVYTDQARGLAVKGPQEFIEWCKGWTTAMSDARVSDARYLDAGDTSVALFVGRGLNDGPVGPLPPSNQQLVFPICEVLTFDADGKVTSGELYFDQATLMVQMGVMPGPPG